MKFKDRTKVFIRTLEDKVSIYAAVISTEEYKEITAFISDNPLPLSKEAKVKFNEEIKGLPKFSEIISVGDPRDVSAGLVKSVMRYVVLGGKRNYQCFMLGNWDTEVEHRLGEPIHYDSHSSWRCLIERLDRPKYIIIYKTIEE